MPMREDESLGARIDRLEMRIAYQHEIIEDLNETITAQWKQIDWLTRQIAQLVERVQEAEHKAGSAPSSERPPHY
jgi:SlyX protein